MTRASGLTVRPATASEELASLHAQLLAPSFPLSELVGVPWLVEGVASGRVAVLVAEDASGPVAIAITQPLAPAPAVLLTYFATRADRRGGGIGTALFEQMLAAVLRGERPQVVLAEVERPDCHAASPEFGDPTARLRFYGRLGARALDLPYFQPPIGTQDAVHGMLLLALHVDDRAVAASEGGDGIPGEGLLAPAVDALLDAGPADDTPAARRLRAASRVPVVALRPVENYARIMASRDG